MEVQNYLYQLVVVQYQRLESCNRQPERVSSTDFPESTRRPRPLVERSKHVEIEALHALKLLSDSCLASVRRFCLRESL